MLETITMGPDRNEWRNHRVADHQRTFRKHFEEPGLADGWLPKTQIEGIVKRIASPGNNRTTLREQISIRRRLREIR